MADTLPSDVRTDSDTRQPDERAVQLAEHLGDPAPLTPHRIGGALEQLGAHIARHTPDSRLGRLLTYTHRQRTINMICARVDALVALWAQLTETSRYQIAHTLAGAANPTSSVGAFDPVAVTYIRTRIINLHGDDLVTAIVRIAARHDHPPHQQPGIAHATHNALTTLEHLDPPLEPRTSRALAQLATSQPRDHTAATIHTLATIITTAADQPTYRDLLDSLTASWQHTPSDLHHTIRTLIRTASPEPASPEPADGGDAGSAALAA